MCPDDRKCIGKEKSNSENNRINKRFVKHGDIMEEKNVATDLINTICSGNKDVEEYKDRHEEFLEQLDNVEKAIEKITVKSIEEYKEAIQLKSITNSMFCYAFNNKKDNDMQERIQKADHRLGKKILKFTKKYNKIKDKTLRSIAKYMVTCWKKYYPYEDKEKIVNHALENNILRKKTDDESDHMLFYVVGLHYKVGNNTFKMDINGNEYRTYMNEVTPQAFPVKHRFRKVLNKFKKEIPDLEDHYKVTYVAPDRQYHAKIYLSKDEKRIIKKNFTT